jgi:hypothetical protein
MRDICRGENVQGTNKTGIWRVDRLDDRIREDSSQNILFDFAFSQEDRARELFIRNGGRRELFLAGMIAKGSVFSQDNW